MNRSNLKTIALIAIPVLLLAAVFGGVAAGALDDDAETITTMVPASASTAEGSGVPTGGEAAASGAGVDADDAGVVDADDRPLGAAELDQVRGAALEIAGGGTVTDVDRSDDLGEAYEVEVLTDVGEVDIALNQDLERVPNLRYDD